MPFNVLYATVILLYIFTAVSTAGLFGTFSSVINHYHEVYKEFCRNTPPTEAFLPTPDLIKFHGYPVETHKVVTADGYIVTVFRIPRGKKTREERIKRTPVLLYHGFLSSSADWLLLPFPEDNLPYLLANNGHDVWLGNVRGNNYSMDSTKFGIHPNDSKYYDFAYDEIGGFDLPAVIDYIMGVTKSRQIDYVGYSMGCALVLVAINEQPRFNKMIRKMSLLAPGVYSPNSKSPLLKSLSDTGGSPTSSQGFSNMFQGGRALPASLTAFLFKNAPKFCVGDITPLMCQNIMFMFGGYNEEQMTNTTAAVVSGHTPSQTSSKIFIHSGQINKAKTFQKYHFGTKENVQLYGSPTPPPYNLSTVTVPVQGFYGLNDLVIVPQDAMRTFKELGNVVEKHRVGHPNWTHLDYVYGKDAKFFVYDQVVAYLGS